MKLYRDLGVDKVRLQIGVRILLAWLSNGLLYFS